MISITRFIIINIKLIRTSLFLSTFRVLSDTKRERETQFLRAYANHTMLTFHSLTPHTRCILWWLRSQLISAGRDPNWSPLIRSEKPNRVLQQSNVNSFFQNPQILNTISSGRDVSHQLISLQRPSSVISCLGFIMTDDDCHILSARACECSIWLWHLN